MSNAATAITNDTQATKTRKPIDDSTFLKISAEYKLCKMLEREKTGWMRVFHRRAGMGLSIAEFDSIARELADVGFCSIKEGERGAEVITLTEHSSPLVDEVCKPPLLTVVDNNPALSDFLTTSK